MKMSHKIRIPSGILGYKNNSNILGINVEFHLHQVMKFYTFYKQITKSEITK